MSKPVPILTSTEIAEQCRALWAKHRIINDGSTAWKEWWVVEYCLIYASHAVIGTDNGHTTGPIRYRVEEECTRRGFQWRWQNLGTDTTFRAWEMEQERWVRIDHVNVRGDSLECALLALKWFLENPVEEDDD